MKLGLLVLEVLLLCSSLGLIWAVLWHQRRLKKLQDALVDELLPGFTPQQRWFRVNVASTPFFAQEMRWYAFEAKGLLIDEGERLRVVAVRPDGRRLEHLVPKTPASIRWRGNSGLSSANLYWLKLGSAPDVVMVCADTGMSAVQSREATADIMRALLPQQPLDASALSDFALESRPATLVLAVAILALLTVSLIDITLSAHQLLQPQALYAVGFLFAPIGLLVYPQLVRHKVPARESLVLSALLVIALAVATPAAALRMDQWLSGGSVAIRYRLAKGALLQPVEPGPPDVTLDNVHEYWAQFQPDSIHELDIVHGPLGTWQLDTRRLYSLTRDWYRREDAAKPAASRPVSTGQERPR